MSIQLTSRRRSAPRLGLDFSSSDAGPRSHWLLPFSLGIFSAFYIPLGGQLYLSEVAVLVLLGATFTGARSPDPPTLRALNLLVALWAFGLVLSSLGNNAPVGTVLPDLTAIALLFASIRVVVRVCTAETDYVALILGSAAGLALAFFIQPNPAAFGSPWKFGVGLSVTIVGIWLAGQTGRLIIRWAVLVGVATLNVLGDFRSMALIVAFVLVADVSRIISEGRLQTKGGRRAFVVVMVLVAAGVGVGVSTAYTALASSGSLGHGASVRLSLQGGGSPVAMLLGGRNEIFYSLPVALQNPIVGLGPEPEISDAVDQLARVHLADVGLNQIAENSRQGSLIAHSHLMGAWVTAGFFGLLVWLYALALVVRALPGSIVLLGRGWLLPGFLLVLTGWNIVFSPFGGSARFFAALILAWAVSISHRVTGPALSNDRRGST